MDYHQNTDQNVSKLDTISGQTPDELAQAAAAAAEQEAAARREPDAGTYTHTLSRPVQWEGKTYEQLTVRWDTLTGADHLTIERELLAAGITLVVPAFTGDYLCGMAARACGELREIAPPSRGSFMRALPLREFSAICDKARRFLLRSESQPETAGSGSGSSV